MNSLLVHKGVYTQQEFEVFFVEWVEKELKRNASQQQSSNVNLISA